MAATVDHLLYGTPDLETGIAEIERLTGVRPEYGGRHVGLGTHNALLSLGTRTYLEVIAPDPAQADVDAALPYGLATLQAPALRAWAAAPDTIEQAAREARTAGVDFGEIVTHGRRAPGGSEVRWRMATRIGEENGLAVVPFLIDWGETTHPSHLAPAGIRLVELRLLSRDPEDLERKLGAIGVALSLSHADTTAIEAVLADSFGQEVVLRS